MTEAKINTSFGEILISYNNIDELQASLAGLEEQIRLISEATKQIIPPALRIPKVGYENAYRFSPNGSVELMYIPPVSLHLVALAMFAYYPEPVTTAELEKVTGITDIVGKVLGQTMNKKFFRKVDNSLYGLSQDGLKLVIEKIKPLFSSSAEGNQE
jgi:hypothetical protein